MSNSLQFYFDFSSPYSYLASEKIDTLAQQYGRETQWHAILLGAVFKALGSKALIDQPGMAQYSLRDFARSARFYGIAYNHPKKFPLATVAAARAFYYLNSRSPQTARQFARRVFRAYFAEQRDISDSDILLALAAEVGVDGPTLKAGMVKDEIKQRLRSETEAAIAQGIFGAPWIVADDEPFWGVDRLPQLEQWLQNGGF